MFGNYKVIPYPISDELFNIKINQFRNSEPILIASKGMEDYAGHLELLDIFRKVKNKIPKANLWFVGDGVMR